jgi:putative heme degradation protein
LRSFEDLGKVHVIVSNGCVTTESVGQFGGFSTWSEFFNVQSKSLDMHIRGARLTTVFAVVKPSHIDGVDTLSFQFYDCDGAAAFKVFVTFGGQNAATERRTLFEAIRDRFRPTPAAACTSSTHP